MALIECPECKKQISDQADSCPGCGYPVSKILYGRKQNLSFAKNGITTTKSRTNSRSAMKTFQCPHCKTKLDITNFKSGSTLQCSICNNTSRVPGVYEGNLKNNDYSQLYGVIAVAVYLLIAFCAFLVFPPTIIVFIIVAPKMYQTYKDITTGG